jgi:hypothetical protein
MEARIARLESDVAHLRTDVADIKADVRTLREKLDSVALRLDEKIDGVKDSLATAKVWALMLYFALSSGVFVTMARSFGWI